MLEQATGILADASSQAAKVLRELLESEDEKTRLHAARVLLDRSLDLTEVTNLQARIETLENQSNEEA